MKTMTKRVASMALATIMAVVLLASALPTKAFAAAATGTLTVSGHAELAGKNVTIVKMFSATKSGDNVGYTLEGAWKAFFQGLDEPTMDNPVSYTHLLIPKYSDCNVTYAGDAIVAADEAGGFAGVFRSGVVEGLSLIHI